MRESMKLLTAGILMLSTGVVSTGAQAAHVCYRLNPFIDILKLEIAPAVNGHRNVYGNWIASGVYTLPVSGAFELNVGSTTARRLGIVGTNGTTNFDDNLICGLDGRPGGTWEVNCAGGPSANFQVSGSPLSVIPCAGLPPSTATGRAIGAK